MGNIRFIGKMNSIQHAFDPPTTLSIGSILQQKSLSKSICRGRPTSIHTSNFHSKLVQDIALKSVYKHPHYKPKCNTAASLTINDVIEDLKRRLNENMAVLQECINTLAEEYRTSKRWKAKFLKSLTYSKHLQKLHKSEELEKHISIEKQHVLVNAILLNPRSKMKNKKYELDIVNPFLKNDVSGKFRQTSENDVMKYNIKSVTLPAVNIVPIYIPRMQQKEIDKVDASRIFSKEIRNLNK
jgi:hypothetical protein